ncbi:hypothetical protein SAMN05216421_1770 [Halopseudomonas xinjiangensis]|uniref:Uncharacterized protein n=1 Tax=Halopseudomonas xinjiangensis TaxID=487184 RepID=A0A1H1TAQ5_9GAMM|nr:hypothetical protein [Halopseudomonas xinjiangensis]SDS57224.1 hypothetical protein SAMN05216421_1770 [Halopseudomonas xinjiangensis]
MDEHITAPKPVAPLLPDAPTNRIGSPTKGAPQTGTLSPAMTLMDTRHLNIKPAGIFIEGKDMLGDATYVASDFPVAYQASQNSQQRSERVISTYHQERVTERAEPRPFNPDEIDRGFVQHGMCF